MLIDWVTVIPSYLDQDAQHSQTIRMIERFRYVGVFHIEMNQMQLKVKWKTGDKLKLQFVKPIDDKRQQTKLSCFFCVRNGTYLLPRQSTTFHPQSAQILGYYCFPSESGIPRAWNIQQVGHRQNLRDRLISESSEWHSVCMAVVLGSESHAWW